MIIILKLHHYGVNRFFQHALRKLLNNTLKRKIIIPFRFEDLGVHAIYGTTYENVVAAKNRSSKNDKDYK